MHHVGDNDDGDDLDDDDDDNDDGEDVHDNHGSDPSRAGLHSHWVEDQVAEILLEHPLSLSSPSRLVTLFPIYTKVVQNYDISASHSSKLTTVLISGGGCWVVQVSS